MRLPIMLVLVAGLGCGSKKEGGGQGGDNAGDQFVLDMAKRNIPKIKAAIASPKPDSAIFDCAHMANIDGIARADKAIAAEYTTLCEKDLWVAIVKVGAEQAEAARKAKPDEQVLSECYNGIYDSAVKELVKFKTIDAAKDHIARFDAACPPKK